VILPPLVFPGSTNTRLFAKLSLTLEKSCKTLTQGVPPAAHPQPEVLLATFERRHDRHGRGHLGRCGRVAVEDEGPML
jgi:hypothetical protein